MIDSIPGPVPLKRTIPPLGIKDLPEAPSFRKLIGPSFIILGLGLGSGEVVLWPHMVGHYGLGVVWGIVLGVTMQFFINMEVERYALVNGESVFVGFARLLKFLPIWFILTTFLGFGWPGIGLYGASLLSHAFQLESPNTIAIILFLIIGCILSVGKVLYRTVETLQKYLIGEGVPLVLLLTLYLVEWSDLAALTKGIVGIGVSVQGDSYFFLPNGIAMGTFLGALAYAGAGGNLNLAQSCYVRDKGYGMGAYAQKITSLFSSKEHTAFRLSGSTFPATPENLRRFAVWWKLINTEHLIVFWALGLFTMLTLSLLAYGTTFGTEGNEQGIAFVINEASSIAAQTLPMFGPLFLLVAGIMLCATQLTVLDSTSRIITENILLLSRRSSANVSRVYYAVLWTQIVFGIGVFTIGFDQPLALIVLGAIINAFSMFVYTCIMLWLNNTSLQGALRPALWRNLVMVATFLFLGFFCAVTLLNAVR